MSPSSPDRPFYVTGELDRIEAALAGDRPAAAASAPPISVGRYQILERIGEGGMGCVYRAQQRVPIERIVALKLIKTGFDSPQVVRRFESERQALAWMDHPNIAKVLDAGADPVSGRPYFVMEYVSGVPITHYCDEHRLTNRQRLDLFLQVCDAVAHAHQKMVVHRDLKPSNILVSSNNGPSTAHTKVIDFGVAKALVTDAEQRTMYTESGQVIGTPEYMSPEQARGACGLSEAGIDTRSDIYSLGVVLYELISGALPFEPRELRSSGIAGMERMICDVDPPRPSTRLSRLADDDATRAAQQRQTRREELVRELKTELEWIPLKAMRKDRSQRYATANELADDVRNYLEGRPLIAAPESRGYRLAKFLRRNKATVAATATIAALLIVGVIVSSVLAVRLKRTADSLRSALREAETARDSARAVNEFLTSDVLAGASPERIPDKSVRDTIVRTMLDPAANAMAKRFAGKPLIEAAVRNTLAQCYQEIGVGDFGAAHAAESLRIRRAQLGPEHPDTLESMSTLAYSLQLQAKLAESERLLREVLAARRRVLGKDNPLTLDSIGNLAHALVASGKLAEAEPLFRESLEGHRRVLGNDDPSTLAATEAWAFFLEEQGKLAEAAPLYKEALAGSRRRLGDDNPRTLNIMSNLAQLLTRQDKLAEAEPLHQEVLERRRRVLGNEHPDTLQSTNNMGVFLWLSGKPAEAEAMYRAVLDPYRRVLGADHPDTIQLLDNLSTVLQEQGKYAEAEPLRREALDNARKTLGDDHPQTMLLLDHFSVLLARQGKLAEAEAAGRDAVERARRVLGDAHPQTVGAINNLTTILQLEGKAAEAEPLARIALANMRRALGDDHPDTIRILYNLGFLLESQGRTADALPVLEEVYRRASACASLPPKDAALFCSRYGPALVKLGKYAEAEQPLRHAHEMLSAASLRGDRRMRVVTAALAEMCEKTGRPDKGARWRQQLAELQATATIRTTTHPKGG